MPSTTAGGLPYPLGTEPVRDGDNAIKSLADALQVRTLGLQFVMGQVIVLTNSAGGWGFTFARPFKTGSVPLVLCMDAGANATTMRILGIIDPATATAVSGVARQYDGTAVNAGNIRITYLAIGTAP